MTETKFQIGDLVLIKKNPDFDHQSIFIRNNIMDILDGNIARIQNIQTRLNRHNVPQVTYTTDIYVHQDYYDSNPIIGLANEHGGYYFTEELLELVFTI